MRLDGILSVATLLAASGAQAPISQGAFVVRLGVDTVAVETFARYADHIEGRLLRRSPRTMVIEYAVTLGADRLPVSAVLRGSPLTGGVLPGRRLREVSIRFVADSADVTFHRDSSTTEFPRGAAPAGFISLPESYALFELWLSRFRSSAIDSTAVTLLAPLGGGGGRMPIRKARGDTVYAAILGAPLMLRVDEAGRLLAVDASTTTLKYEVTRVADADLTPLVARFAALDSAGHGLGVWLSGRDTVTATVGAAQVWVDYGRPARRGRTIFGHGGAVLGDTLWRTGANAATQFRTDRDLDFGGTVIPAGTYTLWTHVHDGAYELVFNRQIGQWGTQHDPAQDFARVRMRRRGLDSPVELFTIAAVAGPGGGSLRLTWDRTELFAEFRLR